MVILDLSLEIVARAERLGRALHPATATQLARTVRIMITHYSNLIEGHNTRPREIKQACRELGLRTIGATFTGHRVVIPIVVSFISHSTDTIMELLLFCLQMAGSFLRHKAPTPP